MKRAIFLLSAVCVIGLMTGCAGGRCGGVHGSCARAPENCVSAAATEAPCQECAQPCEGDCVQQCGFFEKIKGRLGGCNECGCKRCGIGHCRGACGDGCGYAGPYPYYTLRGPRDFLAPCPPSIGP